MEQGISRNQIISELTRSAHKKLSEYVPMGQRAAREDAEFLAHLIAWSKDHVQIRDVKAALPVISLTVPEFPSEFVDNSFAHLALLNPRELLKAYEFSRDIKIYGYGRRLRALVTGYLKKTESSKNWEHIAVQHRQALRRLYAVTHTKPGAAADIAIVKFQHPKGTVFDVIANLKNMSPTEAAGAIMQYKIPFLAAFGALESRAKEPDILLALIERMSPSDLVTNTKMLERFGVRSNPALRAAFEEGLKKVATSRKVTFKTTRAAQDEGMKDKVLKEKLSAVQEKQLKAISVDGNWVVLGDRSGSMERSIGVARMVAATLAKMVKGSVRLVFFSGSPQSYDVTGKTYEQILAMTKFITAGGNTSIGCGLLAAAEQTEEIDGIAIVSDGGENSAPFFCDVYRALSERLHKEVPVYLYHCDGDSNVLAGNARVAGVDIQQFDLPATVDYYSLPDLIATMRTKRYSLVQEIMDTPLLSLADILRKEGDDHVAA